MLNRTALLWPPALTLVLLIPGCAMPPRPPPAPPPGPVEATAPGERYTVSTSEVVVKVYRDGPLARLGHNHVIASTALAGSVVLRAPLEASGFALEMPLASLVVDDPARRAVAGAEFPPEIPAADRDGTRENMLGPRLLLADSHPVLSLDALAIRPEGAGYRVDTRVGIAGKSVSLSLPVAFTADGDQLRVSGEFTVTHAELGLEPFAVAMGALRVREDIGVSFSLVATRDPAAP